ncbi:MAG: BrnT family toxin [Patescibacteria group bacterium]
MVVDLKEILDLCDGFEWDGGNSTKNWLKHKVSWNEIEDVFFNKPLLLKSDKKHSQIETRYWALGKTNANRGLFMSFTLRGRKIRIISARDQNKKERNVYEQTA